MGALAGKIARTAHFFQKYVLPTAKNLGKDALEAALPELGEVIAGRSSIKKATKRTPKETVRKQLGGKRKKKHRKKRETIRVINSRKNQRHSREDFFQKDILGMSTPPAMTHFSVDLFDRVPILEPIECFNKQKIYLTNSLKESSSEFQFRSDQNMMITLQETFLLLKFKLSKRKRSFRSC